jgi:ubiquinone/menaquinone biosynthesis C-methylase UbiE
MSGSSSDTARIAEHYDQFAPRYDTAMRFFERLLASDGRRWVCSKATGDTLEIAIGTGRNLPAYPGDVRLTGIDISPVMLDYAHRRAKECGIAVDLRIGDAQALELGDESFDTVVSTFSMCTIPDYRRAIREARRVLRPGGRLVSLEHVRSPNPLVRAVQHVLDPLSVRFGCDHLLRQPLAALRQEGFEIETVQRSRWGLIEQCSARKPA